MRYALLTTFLIFVLCSASGSAATIAVFGTGVDASGQLLPFGTPDPHYILTVNFLGTGTTPTVPGGATTVEATTQGVPTGWPYVPGFWATDPLAQWIAPTPDVVGIPGTGVDTLYTYQTTFDLTGLDLSTVELSGHWTADNYLSQVLLNGNTIFTSNGCGVPGNYTFSNLTPFSITSGFQPGINTLTFDVINSACQNVPPRTNPTGLLVDVTGSGTVAVPEPGTLTAAAFGLGFVVFSFRRLRRVR